MSVNGWSPHVRLDGVVCSGNASGGPDTQGVWLTPLSGTPYRVSPTGVGPIWAGQTLIYSNNDNATATVSLPDAKGTFPAVIPAAFTEYVGSDDIRWAGANPSGVQLYRGLEPLGPFVPQACNPRFCGASFGYLTPAQVEAPFVRTLVIDNQPVSAGPMLNWWGNRDGNGYVRVVPDGAGCRIIDNKGNDCTIRAQHDEWPIAPLFTGPDGYPWLLSGMTGFLAVRMLYSASGYPIYGDLYYSDARIIGSRLHVVGSLANGQPRDVWINFSVPMVDLRKV